MIGTPRRPFHLRIWWPASVAVLLCCVSHARGESGAVGVDSKSRKPRGPGVESVEKSSSNAASVKPDETKGVTGAVDPVKSGVEKAPQPTVQGTKKEGGTTGSQNRQAGGVQEIKGLEQVGVTGTVQGGVKPPQSGGGGGSQSQANLEVVLRLLGPMPSSETPPSSGGAAAAAAISAGGSSTEERELGRDSRDEIRPSPDQQLKKGS